MGAQAPTGTPTTTPAAFAWPHHHPFHFRPHLLPSCHLPHHTHPRRYSHHLAHHPCPLHGAYLRPSSFPGDHAICKHSHQGTGYHTPLQGPDIYSCIGASKLPPSPMTAPPTLSTPMSVLVAATQTQATTPLKPTETPVMMPEAIGGGASDSPNGASTRKPQGFTRQISYGTSSSASS